MGLFNLFKKSKRINFKVEDSLPKTFPELIEYTKKHNMCIVPGCTTCGSMPFRELCRNEIGFDNICFVVRNVTPTCFHEYYTLDWMYAATILDVEFYKEGRLPRDNFLLQELERLSAEHENQRRHRQM